MSPINADIQLGLRPVSINPYGGLEAMAKLQELQGLAQERQMRAQEIQQRQQILQQAQQAQQRANQIIAGLPRKDDGTYDPGTVLQAIAGSGLPPEHSEKLIGTIDSMNKVITSWNTAKRDHQADLANALLEGHGPNDPVTPDAVHLGLAAAKVAGLANDDDEQRFTQMMGQGIDPEHVLKTVRGMGSKWAKPAELKEVPAGGSLYSVAAGGDAKPIVVGQKQFKDKTELAYAAAQGDPTAQQALDLMTKAEQTSESKMDARWQELESKRVSGQKLTPPEQAEWQAFKNRKALAPQAAASVAIVPVQTVNEQGQPVTQYMTRGQALAAGPVVKPLSGTVQNRVEASKAAVQTGEDIIRQLQDPKVAAQLGPVMGRYNSVREFIGNPPPELSQLAGQIESYAFSQMGVHGMRSTQGAQLISQLLDRKHTPASAIAAIRGINGYASHYVEGATGKPIPSSAPAPAATETPLQRYRRLTGGQ